MIRSVLLVAAALTLGPAAASAQIVYTWGANNYGQLGIGATSDSSNVPVAVSAVGLPSGLTISTVAGGGGHSLAVANGQVYAWGGNADGQLGNGSNTDSNLPVVVSTAGLPSGLTVTAVAGGSDHSLAVANGQAYAWGYNFFGVLGNGTTTNSNVPVAVSTAGVLNGQRVTAVAAGTTYSLAVANGQAFAWGNNGLGQLGSGGSGSSNVPVAVSTAGAPDGLTVTAVAAGDHHSLAVANGQVFAWGENYYGQLGIGATSDSSNVPVAVSTAGALNGKTVTAVAAGYVHSLAVANGQVYAWGYSGFGELGNGGYGISNVPVAVSSFVLNSLNVTEVAAGYESSYALTDAGRLFAWGDNANGELGIGVTGGIFTTPQEVWPRLVNVWTGIDADAFGGHVVATATPVPEPGTLGLIASAGLAAVGFRRRSGRASADGLSIGITFAGR